MREVLVRKFGHHRKLYLFEIVTVPAAWTFEWGADIGTAQRQYQHDTETNGT